MRRHGRLPRYCEPGNYAAMTEQPQRSRQIDIILKICGIASPYLAVLLWLFYFKNAFVSVLLYHLLLFICILGINGKKAIQLLASGFDRKTSWLCLGGLLPTIVILMVWPIAKVESVDIADLFELVGLSKIAFCVFAFYACLVNPFLEESFWRGCFQPTLKRPAFIDLFFGGYHAIIVIPVLKLPFVILTFALMACVSWIFRNIYRLAGGLAIPLGIHIIADIAILAAVWKIIQ